MCAYSPLFEQVLKKTNSRSMLIRTDLSAVSFVRERSVLIAGLRNERIEPAYQPPTGRLMSL